MQPLEFPSVPTQRRPLDDQPSCDEPVEVAPHEKAPDLPAGVAALLVRAAESLGKARRSEGGADRYVAAHLAALRAATAVVVARRAPRGNRRTASVWSLLTAAAPELRGWADFFAAGTDRRVVAEFGGRSVPVDEADRLVERVADFLDVVHRSLSGAAR